MAKPKRKRPFEVVEETNSQRPERYVDQHSGIFALFKDHGVRETVESILVAVILALMFRAYEAEAFIIPTGSMAPTLQGQHMDVFCEECEHQYRAGASYSASTYPPSQRGNVTKTYCPICRHGMPMQVRDPNHVSNNGDRILVNKFVYDFQDPERFDVIVFKNPNNGKQNYIKRLIGLPNENLGIENGDLFNYSKADDGSLTREIVRKPIDKIDVMLQLVDDTHYRSKKMQEADWPNRWTEWASPNTHWRNNQSEGHPYFSHEGSDDQMSWLRYRHLAPRSPHDELVYADHRMRRSVVSSKRPTEWEYIADKKRVPIRIKDKQGTISAGALIRDYYEYNDRQYRFKNSSMNDQRYAAEHLSAASHWVGDLAMECDVEVESDSGTLGLDLVEGGVHFKCLIDVQTGKATLQTEGDDGNIQFDTPDGSPPTADTALKGQGTYNILYVQMDDMVYLRINNRYVQFNGASYTKKSNKRPIPRYSPTDPGDAEPLGVGAKGLVARVNRLKVYRDVFYVSPDQNRFGGNVNIRNETGVNPYDLVRTYEHPDQWRSEIAMKIFNRPQSFKPMFELGPDAYFPMGDNSPASQDARIWDGPKFVKDEMMIGRAMFIYWPHSLNSPKYFPNFKRMGFIR